jgi:hypothetical protein
VVVGSHTRPPQGPSAEIKLIGYDRHVAIDRGGKGDEPDMDEVLSDLEHKIDRLKILYEQYFMGIEKVEPQAARKEVSRKILDLTQQNLRNTGIRYRFNALNQKWNVYTSYWNRTVRAIENGTYIRNVARVGREAARKGQDIPEEVLRAMPQRMRDKVMKDREQALAQAASQKKIKAPASVQPATPAPAAAKPMGPDRLFDADMGFDETFDNLFDSVVKDKPVTPAQRPAATAPPARPPGTPPPLPPPRPAATAPPRPPVETSVVARRPAAPLPSGMTETSAQELFKKYVQAKKIVGESTDNLRYEQLVATMAKQGPKIIEDHKAKGVEFSVVIKDNKVILKATPKK